MYVCVWWINLCMCMQSFFHLHVVSGQSVVSPILSFCLYREGAGKRPVSFVASYAINKDEAQILRPGSAEGRHREGSGDSKCP